MVFVAWSILCVCCAAVSVMSLQMTGKLVCLFVMVIPLFCTPHSSSNKDDNEDIDDEDNIER